MVIYSSPKISKCLSKIKYATFAESNISNPLCLAVNVAANVVYTAIRSNKGCSFQNTPTIFTCATFKHPFTRVVRLRGFLKMANWSFNDLHFL